MSLILDYWRADNMWAARGRPDGNLGMETVTVPAGGKRVFVTDWKYEKMRNDGTNYYGSHARRVKCSGTEPIYVKFNNGHCTLNPGGEWEVQGDIQEVSAKSYGPADSGGVWGTVFKFF